MRRSVFRKWYTSTVRKRDSSSVQHISHHDGTVWRDAFCDCGKKIYKKCLTNGIVEFLTGHGGYERQRVTQEGDASVITIECPHCFLKHKVGNFKENLGIDESVDISLAK